MTRYRLDRSHLMVVAGVCFIIAAGAAVIAFLTAGKGTVGSIVAVIAGVLVVLALLVAAIANLFPPVVLTLDTLGLRSRGRRGDSTWKEVEAVEVSDGLMRFTDGNGATTALPLTLIDRRQRADLIRDVYGRLNTANGYRRFDPAEFG